jgi:hypothetical protein
MCETVWSKRKGRAPRAAGINLELTYSAPKNAHADMMGGLPPGRSRCSAIMVRRYQHRCGAINLLSPGHFGATAPHK